MEGLSLKRALAEIRFTIDQSMYDRIRNTNNLYLQINNASYDEKVSISVNHTSFTSLHKNNTSNAYINFLLERAGFIPSLEKLQTFK